MARVFSQPLRRLVGLAAGGAAAGAFSSTLFTGADCKAGPGWPGCGADNYTGPLSMREYRR